VQPEHPAEEIRHLRRCINNLVSVLALPAIWSGGGVSQVVNTLLDTLLRMLHLDLVYVRLKDPAGEAPIHAVRVAPSGIPLPQPPEICEVLNHCFANDPQQWLPQVRIRLGDVDITIAPFRLGLEGEIGVIVAGAERGEFPEETDNLLLNVAANQASIGLHEARILQEQKRIAGELDQRVAQRTTELAQANEELRLQVGLLQLIPVAAWTLDPDGTPHFVNQNWLEYSGQSLDFVRSHPEAWMTAVHPDDREAVSRSFWDGVRSGQGFTMEARVRRVRDGTYRWHLHRAVALRDEEGKILQFVGTSTDIEDLKQFQDDLRKAEERTRLIIDTALDAVVTMDSRGAITSWNKQAEIIFGWAHAEAIGRHMADLIIPQQHRMSHERGLRHFLNTGHGPILQKRIEITAIRRSGAEFPVELEVVPMKLGQDWVFSAFIRDITESKLAQEKLRQSELHLRQMTETIPEMLWSATPDGAVDYCNARVLDYTGLSGEQIMGSGWTTVLHPDDVEQTSREWMSSVSTGAPYRVEVRTLRAADRTYRWCVTSALPLLDQQGRILKWYGAIVDMHDWRQAQEDLRATQAELAHITRVMTMGELTASIAHEVNQPLAAIIASSDSCMAWLESDPPNLDKARAATARMVQAATQASEIVQRTRAFFKKTSSPKVALGINEAIEEVLQLIHGEIVRKEVSLHTRLERYLPKVSGDRVQLEQVILNLMMNGMEAMAAAECQPKQLVIQSALKQPGEVLVSVSDTGPGIPAEHMNKMFNAFFTTKAEGMGMGLSISRSLIEAHGGRLWVAPNEPRGAVFHFALPVDKAGA
jgi:PAS domain S-box-containing protein